MNHGISVFATSVTFLVLSGTQTALAGANFDKADVRLDKDIKLNVPPGIVANVEKYLQERYRSPEVLKQYGDGVTYNTSTEDFTDVYYDTRDLKLLDTHSEIRHRRRYSNGMKVKEWIQMKLPSTDQYANEEIKFDVKKRVREESVPYGSEAVFPFLDLFKSDEMEPAQTTLQQKFGVSANDMRHILTLRQTRNRVYVKQGGGLMFTFTMDHIQTERWWTKPEFYELELEINEIRYSQADAAEKTTLNGYMNEIAQDLFTKFPALQQEQIPKYEKTFHALEANIPPMRFLIKAGMM